MTFKYLDLSDRINVYAVGDIHGHWDELQEELDKVNFDPSTDALISLGDIVDRGPKSEHIANMFDTYKRYYRVLGNHDIMPFDYLNPASQYGQFYAENGGQWFIDINMRDPDYAKEIANILLRAPKVMTIKIASGEEIGFCHSDCYRDWNSFCERAKQYNPGFDQICLWDRETAVRAANIAHYGTHHLVDNYGLNVKNIDHVFHGHNVFEKVTTVGNRTYIDTGSGFRGGRLSIVNVNKHMKTQRK